MLKNYIKIALRSLSQNKSYTVINILGLAVGMACCILISMYIKEELSFDDFHQKADRIVSVGIEHRSFGKRLSTPYPLADAMIDEIPGVENAVRYAHSGHLKLSTEGQRPIKVTEGKKYGRFTEPSFFDVFSFKLIYGNPQKALNAPNSIVLTQSARDKLFGSDQNPVGRSVSWHKLHRDTTQTLEVTGVIEDAPVNSTIQYGSLISYNTRPESRRNSDAWRGYTPQTFALLASPTLIDNLDYELKELIHRKFEAREDKPSASFFGTPLTDLHLSEITRDEGFTGNRAYLYLFGSVALFILIIACVNYVNLATARISQRSQEVGVRKTLGALRGQVAGQFLGEAVLLSVASYVLGLGISQLVLPYFNKLFGTEIVWQSNIEFLLWLLLAAVGIGLLAGLYPALYLSKFSPVKVLRNKLQAGPSGSWLRKTLVVTQFALAISLIISAMVVQKQLRFTQNKDLGFNGEQVISLKLSNKESFIAQKAIAQNLRSYSGIREVCRTSVVPGEFNLRTGYKPESISAKADVASDETIIFAPATVDYNFLDMMNIEVIAGRDFSKDLATDKHAVILNEKAVRLLGWSPEEAIGKSFSPRKGGKIIGVVENFHIQSLRKEIEAVKIQVKDQRSRGRGFILAKLAPDQIASSMEFIKQEFEKYGNQAFEYEFLDEKFDAMYRTEERLAKIVSFFTVIAIFIACLGLYGLSAFSVDRRIKEIGIRKVLGATVTNIVGLLSMDFLKLVLVGFVIAIPIAWYAMNLWLQDFAYKVEVGATVFILAGISAVLIALITVGWQSVRAAIANPVESLRSE